MTHAKPGRAKIDFFVCDTFCRTCDTFCRASYIGISPFPQILFLEALMVIKPNKELKMYLFEKGITQRQLSFGTNIDEALISKAVKYGQSTPGMREKISRFLNVDQKELFPWDA